MSPAVRVKVDRGAIVLALVVSLFLVLVGLSAYGGPSPYFLALGTLGVAGFGAIAVALTLPRPLSRRDRVASALLSVFVGVLSGSVVILPLMLIPAVWFVATAVAIRN